jgi:hypothetical protein
MTLVKLSILLGNTSATSSRCNTNKCNITFRVVSTDTELQSVAVEVSTTYKYQITSNQGCIEGWHLVNTQYSDYIDFVVFTSNPVDRDMQCIIEYECVDRKMTNIVNLTDSDGKYLSSQNGALLVEVVNFGQMPQPRAELPAPIPSAPVPSLDNITIDIPFKDLTVLGSRQMPLATDSTGKVLTKGENYTYHLIHNGALLTGKMTAKIDCRNYLYKTVYCKIDSIDSDRSQYMITIHASPDSEHYFILKQELVNRSSVFTINEPIGYLRLQIDDNVTTQIYISMY